MAQQEIGHAGIPLPHEHAQMAHVRRHQGPAVLFAEVPVLAVVHRLAVAEMVLAAHHEAALRQPAREMVVPPGVLRHTVDDLHHRPGRALRRP